MKVVYAVANFRYFDPDLGDFYEKTVSHVFRNAVAAEKWALDIPARREEACERIKYMLKADDLEPSDFQWIGSETHETEFD